METLVKAVMAIVEAYKQIGLESNFVVRGTTFIPDGSTAEISVMVSPDYVDAAFHIELALETFDYAEGVERETALAVYGRPTLVFGKIPQDMVEIAAQVALKFDYAKMLEILEAVDCVERDEWKW